LASIGEGKDLASKLAKVLSLGINFQSEASWGTRVRFCSNDGVADDRPSYGEILCAVYEGRKTKRKTAGALQRPVFDEDYHRIKGRIFLKSPLEVFNCESAPDTGLVFPILEAGATQGLDYAAPKGTPVRCVAMVWLPLPVGTINWGITCVSSTMTGMRAAMA